MEDDYKESSVCDDCEIGDGWECQFCCGKCNEEFIQEMRGDIYQI